MMPSILEPLLILGLILVTGYFAGRAANFFGLPRISGYIASGLIFSPSVSGLITYQQIDQLFSVTSEIALAFIAYSIGGSLLGSRVRGQGKVIVWITISQGIVTFVVTSLAIYAVRNSLPSSIIAPDNTFLAIILILGSISVATAPAATMAVIHELRAKGPLTTALLGVVALDDALTIIIFSGAITIASQLLLGAADSSLIIEGLTTVAGAIAIGLIGGLVFKNFLDPKKQTDTNLMLTLGAIFLVSGSADRFNFSPLLANMVMGFVIINKIEHSEDLFRKVDTIKETIFCLFFTLAAAHFDSKIFTSSALLGVVLLLGRFSGKMAGTFLGGKIAKASPQIYKNLGIALLPQAGLSLGLILLAEPLISAEIFDLLLNAMLVSITLNEIISPPLVKWAISQAGETNSDS